MLLQTKAVKCGQPYSDDDDDDGDNDDDNDNDDITCANSGSRPIPSSTIVSPCSSSVVAPPTDSIT